jgi:Reverse transcriptase (RNA-dependent DNA polymerase)
MCNILGLLLTINDVSVLVISVYGPNVNDDSFFRTLRDILNENLNVPVICAGDWNLTYSTDNSNNNIDIINMLSPPSVYRSRLLADVCEEFHLTDPYRAIHHDRRDFTYIPRTKKTNRSRIDFFIVSDNLLRLINSCSISSALETTLFDHKSIFLTFRKPTKSKNNFIDPMIFKHDRFDAVVATAAVETFLQHADPELVDPEQTQVSLRLIGEIINKIMQANELEFEIAFEGEIRGRDLILAGINTEINMLIEDLPDPVTLDTLSLTCNADTFMEILMNNIRNALISFQTWIKKVRNCRSSMLVKKINLLKCNFLDNQDEIFELEESLVLLRDEELRAKINNLKIFEHIHNEKPSPLFLNLIKCRSTDKLSSIRSDTGDVFKSESERHEYIVKYFERVYRKREDADHVDFSNCIGDFLGAEVLNHPVVRNSILSDGERADLDAPLTITELDNSLDGANMLSASGQDGYSNKLIKKCWKYLRYPLLKYSNFCFQTGILTQNFRSATIKLIPKKGDVTLLKNWRPISLLSNMYKIISRAITTRLKKINNRICSRAQKGYNSSRYAQEVLINVCETIQYCRDSGTRAGVLAVDMAKAFDTLDHRFISEVYKFFGLGPNLIRWLELCGNRREAAILLDDNKTSRSFKLGSGRAQGDNASPLTFNFCEQILIFKLELDPLIERIPRVKIRVLDPPLIFSQESNRETDSNESLADDCTLLPLLKHNSLSRVKNIISDFGDISGLRCNYDKTVIMPIFEMNGEEIRAAMHSGFKIVTKITLLGMEITANFEDIGRNFLKIRDKILNLIAFWERFRLSLSGRIAISKTFLVSQLNYLGCTFNPPAEILADIQGIINKFIKKNLNISTDRIYRDPDLGGLGFFKLDEFLAAQRCTWVFRAHKLPIDNWRYDLHVAAPDNNVLKIRKKDINVRINPVLYGIVSDFENFYGHFSSFRMNYEKAWIFENPAFTRPNDSTKMIDRSFFGVDFFRRFENTIRNVKFCDCFLDGAFKSLETWRNDGLPLSIAVWLRLRNAILFSKLKFQNNITPVDAGCEDLPGFSNRLSKGSKKIRKFYDKARDKNVNVEGINSLITFQNLVGIAPSSYNFMGCWLATWKTFQLSSDIKTFIYNCRFNILPLNNRLNAYRPEIDPRCTFCRIRNANTMERDGFLHCFFSCPVVKRLIIDFFNFLGVDIDIDTEGGKNLYWYGLIDNDTLTVRRHLSNVLVFDLFRYIVYKYRLKRRIPNIAIVVNEITFIVQCVCNVSRNINLSFVNNNLLAMLLQARG